MPRRNYNEDDFEEATFSEDYRSVLKEKHMTAGNTRLASHNKTRVAYFHDEGVGNYHYGVKYIYMYTYIQKEIVKNSSFSYRKDIQ